MNETNPSQRHYPAEGPPGAHDEKDVGIAVLRHQLAVRVASTSTGALHSEGVSPNTVQLTT